MIYNKVERINEAFVYLKKQEIVRTQKDIAKKMDMSTNTISQALNGNEKYLTTSFLKKFCLSFDCFDEGWLIYGKGQMLKKSFVTIENTNNNDSSVEDLIADKVLNKLLLALEPYYNELIDKSENKTLNLRLNELEQKIDELLYFKKAILLKTELEQLDKISTKNKKP